MMVPVLLIENISPGGNGYQKSQNKSYGERWDLIKKRPLVQQMPAASKYKNRGDN